MIETERLILRQWKDSDLEPFARLNADPQVGEFLRKPLSRAESDEWVGIIKSRFAEHGFNFFAAESKTDGRFVGLIGLNIPTFTTPFSPFVEIGWRLLPEFWNQGLATEGAAAVLKYSAETLQLSEIVAFTVPANLRSRRVMEKIGMKHDLEGDFFHPRIPARHPLSRHVLYRWKSGGKPSTAS